VLGGCTLLPPASLVTLGFAHPALKVFPFCINTNTNNNNSNGNCFFAAKQVLILVNVIDTLVHFHCHMCQMSAKRATVCTELSTCSSAVFELPWHAAEGLHSKAVGMKLGLHAVLSWGCLEMPCGLLLLDRDLGGQEVLQLPLQTACLISQTGHLQVDQSKPSMLPALSVSPPV